MKTCIKWTSMALIAILTATAIGTTGITAIYAQDATLTPAPTSDSTAQTTPNAQAQQQRAALIRLLARAILDAAAKDLNVDKPTLLKDIASGKTMADIIAAHNGDIKQIETDAKPAIEDAI